MMTDGWKCPICGKDLTEALKILGDRRAIYIHLRAHQIEVLGDLITQVRALVAADPVNSPLAVTLHQIDAVDAAVSEFNKR